MQFYLGRSVFCSVVRDNENDDLLVVLKKRKSERTIAQDLSRPCSQMYRISAPRGTANIGLYKGVRGKVHPRDEIAIDQPGVRAGWLAAGG